MNFLPAEASVAAFIETSLEALQREFPSAYYRMCACITGRSVSLTIDQEPVTIVFEGGAVRLVAPLKEVNVSLSTSRQTILDVIDAKLTLQEAVDREAILLQGTVEDLAAFDDGLQMYVRGAVRCPSFPGLLDRFRRPTSRRSPDRSPVEAPPNNIG